MAKKLPKLCQHQGFKQDSQPYFSNFSAFTKTSSFVFLVIAHSSHNINIRSVHGICLLFPMEQEKKVQQCSIHGKSTVRQMKLNKAICREEKERERQRESPTLLVDQDHQSPTFLLPANHHLWHCLQPLQQHGHPLACTLH